MSLDNEAIAAQLDELASLLEAQNANPYRVAAYRNAAHGVRELRRPVREILQQEGEDALKHRLGLGPNLLRALTQVVRTGHLGMLGRLRGETPPEAVLRLVPAIGPALAQRIHEELGVETVAELERAIVTGRIASVEGMGPKRLRALQEFFHAAHGRHMRPAPAPSEPSVAELLDVDAEYRRQARIGALPRIAPRNNNPGHEAWLPILHTERGDRHYTVLYSNTERAHRLGKTHDWVVIYGDDESGGQWTVITSTRGALIGLRIVQGREGECSRFYALRSMPTLPRSGTEFARP